MSKHGGAREGAGAKKGHESYRGPADKAPFSTRMRKDLLAGLDLLAGDKRGSKVAVLEAAVEAHLDLFLPDWKKQIRE